MTSKNYFKKSLKLSLFLILTLSLLIPLETFALIPNGGTGGDENGTEDEGGGLIIENPLSPYSDIWQLIMRIIDIIFNIAILATAILIVYAGFLFITAGGQEERIKTAQKTLTWAVVGLAIVILAKAVPPLIYELLTGQQLPEYSNSSSENEYYSQNNFSGFSNNIYPSSPILGGMVESADGICEWDDNASGDDDVCRDDLLLL